MTEQLVKVIDSVLAEKYSEADPIMKEILSKRVETRVSDLYKKFDDMSANVPLHETKWICEAVTAKTTDLPVRIKSLVEAVAMSNDADITIELINQAAGSQVSQAHAEMSKMQHINPFTPTAVEREGGSLKQINDVLFKDSKWKSALKDLVKAGDNIRDPSYWNFVQQYCEAVSAAFNSFKNTNLLCFSLINHNFSYLEALAKKYA